MLAGLIQKETRAHTIEVELRRDTWFASMWFPLFFRFEPDDGEVVYLDRFNRIAPPKVSQFYEMPRARCFWNAGNLNCDRYDFVEHLPQAK